MTALRIDPQRAQEKLSASRLMLLFTPELCRLSPLEALEAALPWIDVVQVRMKHPENGGWSSPAEPLHRWTSSVLDLLRGVAQSDALVIVNDRVDVAQHLEHMGVAGVHLGATDCPPQLAREALFEGALIGLSTHSAREVVRAGEEPIDYLGFGPLHATATKGYARGHGPEAAWVASSATRLPVFPIGGIDRTNVGELSPVGRAAVSSAILGSADPGAEAQAIASQLLAPADSLLD